MNNQENSPSENLKVILDAIEPVKANLQEQLSDKLEVMKDHVDYDGRVTDTEAEIANAAYQRLVKQKSDFITGTAALMATFGQEMQGLLAETQAVLDSPALPAAESEVADVDVNVDINVDDINIEVDEDELAAAVNDTTANADDDNVVDINAAVASAEAEVEPSEGGSNDTSLEETKKKSFLGIGR